MMNLLSVLMNATALTGATMFLAMAQAQTSEPAPATQAAEEEVVVTGSRVRRADIEGVGPVTVITEADIKNSGIVSLDTLLQRLPASAGAAGSQTSAYWTSRGWGTTQVNLRGLGINRTLTLLNGRRLVNGGTGANSAPDLNMIPTSIIGRIEVLKDGASAAYGADAVAGVVNLITRTDLEGISSSVRYGLTEEGDGGDWVADVAYGLQTEGGSVTLAASYQKTDPINMADRAPCPLAEVGGTLICRGGGSTAGGRATVPGYGQINFTGGDSYEPYNALIHGFNGNPFINAVNPVERFTFAAFAEQDIGGGVELFGELLFTHRDTEQLSTPGTLAGFVIPASNPTNPFGVQFTLTQRRLVEGGVRVASQSTDTYQAVVGARGDLIGDWTWEAAFNFGRNSGTDGFSNIANKERVANTLNTSVCSFTPGAAIPCADYLGPGEVNDEVLKYILTNTLDTGGNETTNFTFDTNGSLFSLPAGDVQAAAGFAYRKDKGWRYPDNLIVLGIANSNQQQPIDGSIEAVEGYAEISVPVLKDLPLIEMLRIDAAVRYSDYDRFGSDTNYKIAADWAVGWGFRIRSTYGTAFRVPSVAELFGGVTQGQLTTTDPCSNYSASSNAVLVANCQASGVPAGFVQPNNFILTTTGGNVNLTPEAADTFTLGLVWDPDYVSGLTLTVDYFDIKIENAIRSISGSTKLSVCYNSVGLSHPFCSPSNFTRNALTGEINYLSSQQVNVGSETMKGVDVGARYMFDIENYAITIDANVTYLDEYVIVPYPGAAPIVYDGFIGGGNGGYPKWRGLTSVSVDSGDWQASYSVQWIGSATDFNAAPTAIGYRTPNVFYHNVQFAYRLTDNVALAAGIDNLFDESAPYLPCLLYTSPSPRD